MVSILTFTETTYALRIAMAENKSKGRTRARPLGGSERRLACKGCGERGAMIYHADGTPPYLTGLFYFYKQKCRDGGAVIACGRCQQIYLERDDAKAIKSRLSLPK